MKAISLYIHIPFCIKKCGYCDFISFNYESDKMKCYLGYLKKEISLYKKELKDSYIKTIFIGGGTPSLMSGNQMKDLMKTIETNFDLSKCDEISMESNPGTLTLSNLIAYKEAGINRISVGVQTLNNHTLKSLDRIHDVNEVYEAISNIKEAGFTNFNMDLMFSLPGQTLKDLESSLDNFIKLKPTHISAYSLKYEEGTDFYKKLENDELIETEEDEDRDMYHLIINKLKDANYLQYEISNFAKEGLECKHNLVYWKNKEYIGFGLGAHSSCNRNRFFNEKTFKDYYDLIDSEKKPIEGTEEISLETSMFETIMLSLRLNSGLNLNEFNLSYSKDFTSLYKKELKKLKDLELLEIRSDYIKLTEKGRDLSNQVFLEFLK